MKEYMADNVIQEIEKVKEEIAELLHDRPTRYINSPSLYFTESLKNIKGNGYNIRGYYDRGEIVVNLGC